uniref:LETM1 domain containing 1 n=1 Tax=Astyanax mexicanus TaxID=7994 RepID=A0A3B1J7H9_ASTMX
MALPCMTVCSRASVAVLCGIRAPAGFYTRTPAAALCLVRQYSPSQARHGIGRNIVSKLKWANEKYERFLQRRFPRFYVLYHTFMKGFRLLFQDAKEIRRIKTRMITNNIDYNKLPYREMEKLRQVRKDMIKAIPLVIISIPPFANYLVFVLMYLFPRQLLIRHFWTPQQLLEFQAVYHKQRAQHHQAVLSGLERTAPSVQDNRLRSHLLNLCSKVQSGAHPVVSDIHAVRPLFSGPPFGIRRMYSDQMHYCNVFFSQRYLTQPLSIRLDALIMYFFQACYVRGLNVERLNPAQCRDWLTQWLQFSSYLKESETSLYLHSMVLLTVNYLKPPRS